MNRNGKRKAAEATALPLGGRPPRNQLVIASGGRSEAPIRGGGGGGDFCGKRDTGFRLDLPRSCPRSKVREGNKKLEKANWSFQRE